MRGADICKGIAAGADCVAMGRFVGIALAAGGEEAVVRAFDLLLEEMHTVLSHTGPGSVRLLVSLSLFKHPDKSCGCR